MPLLLQRYARFTDNVIYQGADMESTKLNARTEKSNSKRNKSQRKTDRLADLPKSGP
jgi:hypothetical protein